jgi:hypothetical protein
MEARLPVSADDRRETALTLTGEAREIALAEAQAVLAIVQDAERRARLASLAAAASEGQVAGEDAQALEELLELGLQTGRVRALYGPGGEQAALATYRRLPRGAEVSRSASGVTSALRSLCGRELDAVSLQVIGPGAFSLSLSAGGLEVSVRLDRDGARLASLGV